MKKTLYDKLWDEHHIHTYENGYSLIYIDKHLSKYYGEEDDNTTDAFMEALDANIHKLQFLQCVRELYNFSVKYKFDDEAVCSLVADMEEQVVF